MPSRRATARETLLLPEPEGPSMAIVRGAVMAGQPSGGSAVQPPAPRLEGHAEPGCRGGHDVDLGEPERLAQPVVEVELLDVGADRADVGEQPAQLARLVGDEHPDRRVGGGSGTVLAGDAGLPGVAG